MSGRYDGLGFFKRRPAVVNDGRVVIIARTGAKCLRRHRCQCASCSHRDLGGISGACPPWCCLKLCVRGLYHNGGVNDGARLLRLC